MIVDRVDKASDVAVDCKPRGSQRGLVAHFFMYTPLNFRDSEDQLCCCAITYAMVWLPLLVASVGVAARNRNQTDLPILEIPTVESFKSGIDLYSESFPVTTALYTK